MELRVKKTTIQLGRVMRPAGSSFTLDDEAEAQRLIATGAAEAVEPAQDRILSEEETFFAGLNAKDGAEFVGTVETVELLSRLARIEETRKGGARKTVTDAIAAKGAALTSGTAGGAE